MYLTTKEMEKYVNVLFKKNPKSKQEVKALYPNLSKDHIDRIYARYLYLKENQKPMNYIRITHEQDGVIKAKGNMTDKALQRLYEYENMIERGQLVFIPDTYVKKKNNH